MSTKKLARKQKRQQNPNAAAKTSATDLAARRARTLIVGESSKAVLIGYRDLVVRECNAALAMLEQLEPFTRGAKPPALIEAFAAALQASASTDDEAHEDGIGQLCSLTDRMARVALAETVVLETYAQAAGVCDTPIEVSLRRIRDELAEHNPGRTGLRDIEQAFRAPLGGSTPHRRVVGIAPDATDQAVIASSDQWLWFHSAKGAANHA
jgi:hypothetical protein